MATPASDGPVTSRYGPRKPPTPTSSNFHRGEDRVGRGNVSPEDGQVVYCGYAGTWGNTVVVRTPAGVHWLIAHFARLDVRMNQSVSEGFWLGQIGTTGASTGVHSHTERRIGASYANPLGGAAVDPAPVLAARPAPPAPAPPPPPEKHRRPRMSSIIEAKDSNGHIFYFAPGYVKHLADLAQVNAMQMAESFDGVGPQVNRFDNGDFQRAIWGYGLQEFSFDDVLALAGKPGGMLVASWLRGPAPQLDAAVVRDAISAATREALKGAVPTAEQNGAAARKAIVAP